MPNPILKYQPTGGVTRSSGPVITVESTNGDEDTPILDYQPGGGPTTGSSTIGQRQGYLYYWPDIENLTGGSHHTDLDAQDISILPSESLIIVITGVDGDETHWCRMPDYSSPVTDVGLGIIVPLNYDSETRPWVLLQELTGGGGTNAFGTIAVGGTNIVADSAPDTLNLIAGTNITLTPDAFADSITIATTGGAGSGISMSSSVTQTIHGFVVGNVLRYTGTAYAKAQADVAANAEVVGLVSAVTDANNFTLTTGEAVTGLSGLTAGSVYFLSTTTAGLLTTTAPTVTNQVSKPLLVATSATGGYFFNWRGWVVGSAAAVDGGAPVGGTVDSVFARTGDVLALSGDYAAFYQPLDSDLTTIATATPSAGQYYGTNGGGTKGFYTLPAAGGVTSFNTRTGAVVPAANDYTFAQLASKPTTLSGYGITDAQPLDADLTSLAAASATGAIYYRSAANTWGPVTIGSGLSFTTGTLAATAGGGGTVTDFSAGDLAPLFTTSEATTTTTPALSFALTNAAATTVFGRAAGTSGAPTYSSSPQFLAIGNLTSNGFVKTGGGVGTLSVDTATYLTANQNISLTGDVTGGPAATAITTTIGANKVTLGMMATLAADSIIGNTSASPATPVALTSLPFVYTGDVTRAADSNATVIATDAVTTAKILNSNVTYAKIQNVTATSRFLGRITAAAGVVEELTAANAKTILALTSSDVGLGSVTNAAQTLASVVPNTLPAPGQLLIGNAGATAYAPVTMGTDATITSAGALTIANNAVTLGKMATMATDSILGRATAATGNVEVLSSLPFAFTGDVTRPVDSNVTTLAAGNAGNLNSGTLLAARMPALTGDVTTTVGTVATTIAANAVTYAKMQALAATSKLLGSSATTTPVQEITLGSGLSMSGTTLSVSAGGGNVSSAGTPANDQIAIWTSASTIEGDAGLTYTTGSLTLSANVAATSRNNLLLDNTNTTDKSSAIVFRGSGPTQLWSLGNDYSTNGAQTFFLFDSVNAVVRQYWSTGGTALASDGIYGWASTTSAHGAVDTAIARNAAGVVEVNSGAAGTYRDLKLRNLILSGTSTQIPAASPTGLFLKDDGTWAAPGGGGGIGGSTGATDNAILRADGTGGATAQNSLISISDTGYFIMPTSGGIIAGESNGITFYGNGTTYDFYISASNVGMRSGQPLGWTSSALSAITALDTALARNAAGVVEINNGTAAQYRDLKARTVNVTSDLQVNGISTAADYLNSSVSSQSLSTADVYVTGSSVVVPAGGFKAKGQYRCVFDIVKSAGTGTIVLTFRIGTAGTTADTSRIAFTFPAAGTSVADTGNIEVCVNWRTVGSGTSAVVAGFCRAIKNTITAAGLWSTTTAALTIVGTVSGGFDSSAATTIGLSFNGSTSFAGTITTVQATLAQ